MGNSYPYLPPSFMRCRIAQIPVTTRYAHKSGESCSPTLDPWTMPKPVSIVQAKATRAAFNGFRSSRKATIEPQRSPMTMEPL